MRKPTIEYPNIIYEEDKIKVLEALKNGEVSYVDVTSWGFMDKFFAFLFGIGIFEAISSAYPSPRERENLPLPILFAAQVQLRLHLENAIHNLPYILNSVSIIERIGYNIGFKDGGFNRRNKKERIAPFHHDAFRKFFKDTNPDSFMRWYNSDVIGFLHSKGAFDPQGIFILDSSFLPLPNNPNYENAALLPLDEDDNYIDVNKLSPEERKKVKYTRCYNLTSLLHTNFSCSYFLFAGSHLGPGKESGLTEGEKLVDNFIEQFGKGSIKILIMDRGFLDGEMIARFKKKYGIDVIIPLKSNMHAFLDALGLSKLPEVEWIHHSTDRDKSGQIIHQRFLSGIHDITSWETCKVPLHVVLVKEIDKEGNIDIWSLATTKDFSNPIVIYNLYHKRSQIEERWRQLKLFWGLYAFTSTAFSLVLAQVLFILLTYSLLQLYLKRKDMQQLANATIKTLKYEEMLGKRGVIVYYNSYFATFSALEYQYILLNLTEAARKRLLKRTRKLKKIRPP